MSHSYERPVLVGWRNAILTAFALGGVSMAAFGSRLPSIQADLDVSKGTIGTILVGLTIGSLLGLGVSARMHRSLGRGSPFAPRCCWWRSVWP